VSVVLVDIDGTLDLGGGRVNEPLVAAINDSGYEAIVVSARQDSRLNETRQWLNDSGLKFSGLHLSDFPPGPNANVAFKSFKAKALIDEGKDVEAAIDNDSDARAAYRELDLEVYSPEEFVSDYGSSARAIDPDGYEPTAEMRAEAERGLEWRREFGRGGTEVGIARARDISNGRRLPYETVVRMSSYFARHAVDKEADGFRPGEDGYPSNGRIAWALWSGDSGEAWASRIIREASAEDAQRNEGDEMAIEFRRTTAELRAVDDDGFTFEGMAAVYDSPSAEGTNPEIVKKGAFARSLAAASRGEWDVKAYADHNPERLLGTTKTGTLELEDREDGLLARIRLNPNVTFHRDLAEIVRTMGKSLGLSFGFYSTNANKVNEDGVRELRDVKLVEVSALTGLSPYYPSTISTVSVRSLASEAGLEIEPLRAAVNALLSGQISTDQAKILAEAIAAVIAEDEADQAEDVSAGEVVVEDMPVENSAPRSVPRSTREKEIELAKRALK
jgi:HK97 family phage prohead protease